MVEAEIKRIKKRFVGVIEEGRSLHKTTADRAVDDQQN